MGEAQVANNMGTRLSTLWVSRVLKRGTNRWANTVAAVITTAFVVGGGSLTPHYVFFAAVEIACMALIVWSVWMQRTQNPIEESAA
jgi:mannose/fructose/N-acetylgalactosamine-specific phosphotransferase system component IIC